jgi:hypothetical protein
MTSLLFLAKVR